MITIGQASIGETGAYYQKAGDQTGKELNVRDWYCKPWDVCLRPLDPLLGDRMAELCEKAVANRHIGYDQTDRSTYWMELKKVGFDPSKIETDCECDCSSLQMSNYAAAVGDVDGWQWVTTHNLESALLSTGRFTALHGVEYTQSADHLRRGDILCKAGAHVVIVLNSADPQEDYFPAEIVDCWRCNMRSGPSTDYGYVTVLAAGDRVDGIEVADNGWLKCRKGDSVGYVSKLYWKATEQRLKATGNVYLRTGAGTANPVCKANGGDVSIPRGTIVKATGETKKILLTTWHRVTYNGVTGWASGLWLKQI